MKIYIAECLPLCGVPNEIKLFGNDEIARLSSITNDKYKAQSIAGLSALYRAVLEGGYINSPLKISRKYSKPCFADNHKFDFNISHSGELAVAVLVSNFGVGIDIQKISEKRINEVKIAERFFSENEKRLLEKSEKPQEEFYKIWTAKEAMAKCIGDGLSVNLARDTVYEKKGGEFFFSELVLEYNDDKYIVAVCTDAPHNSIESVFCD